MMVTVSNDESPSSDTERMIETELDRADVHVGLCSRGYGNVLLYPKKMHLPRTSGKGRLRQPGSSDSEAVKWCV